MALKMLHNIQIPTLVITAEYDLELCKEIADIIVKEIPNAKLISLKKAGHIMNMDQAQEFNKQVSSFIDEISR